MMTWITWTGVCARLAGDTLDGGRKVVSVEARVEVIRGPLCRAGGPGSTAGRRLTESCPDLTFLVYLTVMHLSLFSLDVLF